ncbi:MAG: ATP-dependent zinc metalloprotease FtsH [Myxococcota bacterium]
MDPRSPERSDQGRGSLWRALGLVAVGALLLVFIEQAATSDGGDARVAYTELKDHLRKGEVESVSVGPEVIVAKLKDGHSIETVRIEDPKLLEDLERAAVPATGTKPAGGSWLATLLAWTLPLVLLFLFFAWSRQAIGKSLGKGIGGSMPMAQSRPKLYAETDVKVAFDDVAGVDEAKEELHEIIDFLRAPAALTRLGGRIPKGILLVGPPGTGKTLLARAVAGEACVPFFSISGSEFVELFVGVGAARVRDLFHQARERAPCIIFIDELDALGKVRGAGPGAHEEREQTLNQLLVEMDGFDPRTGIILMAATNRPEVLDPALLRSGRFDRHVLVDRPDMLGRLAILRVHAKKARIARPADLEAIAQMTPGLVGADLANVINESALLAARHGHDAIDRGDLQEAVERIVAGLEKKNRVLSQFERERVAHHEVGHALVATALPGSDQVQKISIIPRGIAALGYTLQRPTEDRFLMTRSELENRIAVMLGGRVAEELCFGEPSTGARDDLRKATDIATSMVRAFAMGADLGLVSFEPERHPLWIDSDLGEDHHSDRVRSRIDAEVARILDAQHARVTTLLGERMPALRAAAAELMRRETMSGDELRAIAAGHAPAGAPPSRADTVPARVLGRVQPLVGAADHLGQAVALAHGDDAGR